jgi:hypothetical protein
MVLTLSPLALTIIWSVAGMLATPAVLAWVGATDTDGQERRRLVVTPLLGPVAFAVLVVLVIFGMVVNWTDRPGPRGR